MAAGVGQSQLLRGCHCMGTSKVMWITCTHNTVNCIYRVFAVFTFYTYGCAHVHGLVVYMSKVYVLQYDILFLHACFRVYFSYRGLNLGVQMYLEIAKLGNLELLYTFGVVHSYTFITLKSPIIA